MILFSDKMLAQKDLNIIIKELQELAKKDTPRAIKVERIITDIIKLHPEKILQRKSIEGLVKEVYEDLHMRDDLDKTNTKKVDNSFLKKTSRIGRIDKKKAWHNLIYNIHKNEYRLNFKELVHKVNEIEKTIKLPDDYDISQTAKIRDEYVFIKDNKLNFHALEKSQDIIKKIKLKDNCIIILGRNIVYRINLNDNQIENDNPNCFGLMPLDLIIYI